MLAAIIDTFPLRVFSDFKTKLDANALFGTFTHRKNRWHKRTRYFRELQQPTEQTQPLATCVMSCYAMYEHAKTGCKHIPPSEQPQIQSGHYLIKPRTWTSLTYPKRTSRQIERSCVTIMYVMKTNVTVQLKQSTSQHKMLDNGYWSCPFQVRHRDQAPLICNGFI